MSVKEIRTRLISAMLAELAPAGFRARARSLWRKRNEYLETFTIRGSHWNSGQEPWCFYVDVTLRYEDIPRPRYMDNQPLPQTPTTLSWGHGSGNLHCLLSDAPIKFEVATPTLSEVSKLLVRLINKASEQLSRISPRIHSEALEGKYCPLIAAAKFCSSSLPQQAIPADRGDKRRSR